VTWIEYTRDVERNCNNATLATLGLRALILDALVAGIGFGAATSSSSSSSSPNASNIVFGRYVVSLTAQSYVMLASNAKACIMRPMTLCTASLTHFPAASNSIFVLNLRSTDSMSFSVTMLNSSRVTQYVAPVPREASPMASFKRSIMYPKRLFNVASSASRASEPMPKRTCIL